MRSALRTACVLWATTDVITSDDPYHENLWRVIRVLVLQCRPTGTGHTYLRGGYNPHVEPASAIPGLSRALRRSRAFISPAVDGEEIRYRKEPGLTVPHASEADSRWNGDILSSPHGPGRGEAKFKGCAGVP